jgi:hypothetical protein
MGSFLKSWKTTAIGLALGAANLLANGVHPKQVGLSVLLAALGIASKDFNSTTPIVLPVPAGWVQHPAVQSKQ